MSQMFKISHHELGKLGNKVNGLEGALARAKEVAAAKAQTVKEIGEATGAAAIMGALRGYMEKNGKSMELPYIGLDAELVVGLGLAGSAMFDLGGEYNDDLTAAAIGVLAHYTGQLARNSTKAGKLMLVAGDCVGGDCGSPIAGALASNI